MPSKAKLIFTTHKKKRNRVNDLMIYMGTPDSMHVLRTTEVAVVGLFIFLKWRGSSARNLRTNVIIVFRNFVHFVDPGHGIVNVNRFYTFSLLKISFLGEVQSSLTPSPLETLFFTNLLEVSIGRDFGALKGLREEGAPYQNKVHRHRYISNTSSTSGISISSHLIV